MVDAILNQGLPAPIDVQVNTRDLDLDLHHRPGSRPPHPPAAGRRRSLHSAGHELSRRSSMDIDRVHAGELGLSQKDVVNNVITALNSNYHDRSELLGGL